MRATPVRITGSALAGAAGAGLLLYGRAPWPAAVLGGAGAALFVLWRTVAGVLAAFALLLAGALAAWLPERAPPFQANGAWLGGPAVLEAFGLATIAAVRAARDPVRISRRLLGAWLASTGAIVLGVALAGRDSTAAAASMLVTFGLLYKLGVVPAYAWAPMLLRHPAPRITMAGAAASALAGLTLIRVLPRLPDPAGAGLLLAACCIVTTPWAAWQMLHRWRDDRRCALTWAVVAAEAIILLLGGPTR